MHSNAQVFLYLDTALWTLLRSPPRLDFTVSKAGERTRSTELSSLPTHVLSDGSELPESSIKHVFPKQSLTHRAIVQVFHEDHITSITEGMSLLEVEVRPCVVNPVVKSCNFKTLSVVVLRPPLLSTQPTLQQFQLAL